MPVQFNDYLVTSQARHQTLVSHSCYINDGVDLIGFVEGGDEVDLCRGADGVGLTTEGIERHLMLEALVYLFEHLFKDESF